LIVQPDARHIEEIEGNGVSLINEPLPPENVSTLVRTKQRSLHASFAETLASSRGLLARLENGRVQAPPGEARVAIREAYVQLRRTVPVLSRCLELSDLE
jgi:hypothetical protein